MKSKTIKNKYYNLTIKKYNSEDFWLEKKYKNGATSGKGILKEEFDIMKELDDAFHAIKEKEKKDGNN